MRPKKVYTEIIWQNIDRKLQINAQKNSSWALSDPRNHTSQIDPHGIAVFNLMERSSEKEMKPVFSLFELAFTKIRTGQKKSQKNF